MLEVATGPFAEDEMLCNVWVRVSTDPITGDSQKKQTFWRRDFVDFVKQHEVMNEPVTRNQKACDQRFQLIRAECNKWSACLKKVNDHPRSEENTVDAAHPTHVLYKGQNNKWFKLEHCWEILRNCAKYQKIHGATSPYDFINFQQRYHGKTRGNHSQVARLLSTAAPAYHQGRC